MFNTVVKNCKQYAEWYLSLSSDRLMMSQQDFMLQLYVLNKAAESASVMDPALANKIVASLNSYANMYKAKTGQSIQ